ncbi:MAG: putative Ig domain-containing protein [Candidatus Krumholzibacteria bacterium]|nr:putative Ig domain-containing protein [Candidatus Krumholzibacteria bacterium]
MRSAYLFFLILLLISTATGPALGQGRVTDGQQALYGFEEGSGSTVHDISGVGSPLDLAINDPGAVTWIPGGGLTLNLPALISSAGPATKIIESAMTSNALTVEAWVTPANTTQDGPARIVTLSEDPYVRNFTLGQGAYEVGSNIYSMRLRSTETDLNGLPSLATDPGSLTTTLTHVVFTRDAGGTNNLYMDGVLVATDNPGGDLSNWDTSYALALGNEAIDDRPWLGDYHLVAIFDRALSGVEVQQNFTAGPFITPQPPTIVVQPVNKTVIEGQAATFSVIAAGTGPLAYQWQKNQADIPGATGSSYNSGGTTLADDGAMFRCVVTNSEGQAISDEALLTVQEYSGVLRIMPLGDSITYDNHTADTRPEGERISYRYPLWQLLTNAGASFEFVGGVNAGYDIIPDPQDAHNEGWPGWTDTQIADNIYNWLVANPADIILLHIGTNALNASSADVENILNEIDRYETDSGLPVHVLLARIINRSSYSLTTTQFNNNVEAMAMARVGDAITMVDMEDGADINYAYASSGGDMYDNLHPTDDGYAKMAYAWYVALQALMPDASLNCPPGIDHYWMMEKEFAPYVNQFGMIARSTDPPSWTSGRVGYAQLFDYTNEVNVEDDGSLDWGSTDSFTMEFWMKKANPVHGNTVNENEVILGRDDPATQQHWWLGVSAQTSPPGQICYRLHDNNANSAIIYSTTAVQDGVWHHIAAVRDNATGMNYLYVDGVLENSIAVSYPAGFAGNDVPLNVGWLNLSGGFHYDGILDEVAFYDRALGETDIMSHFVAGSGGMGYCTGGEMAPIITSNPVTHIYADQLYAYDVQAVGNPTPGYALLNGPAGMTIDAATGLIDWTPTGIGDFPVEVESSNTQGTDTQMFTLSVTVRPLCPEGMDTYWKLDETSGNTYADYYGGYDGQALASPPTPASPGVVGDCQDFNGTSNYISVSDDPVFDWAADENFTIELWFNLTNVASRNKVMIGRDQNSSTHWWLGVNMNTGYATWNLLDANRTGVAVSGSTSLNDGQWHHMVAVRDESLNQNRLYVDGGLVGTSVHDYTAGFQANTTTGIGYMAYNNTPDYFYDGLLDEVALYTRALSVGEIADHWNEGAGKSYCSDDAEMPVIISTPVASGVAGESYAYDVDAAGNPAPVFDLLTYPAGMTIDSVTGVIDWLPTASGIYDVEVEATNAMGSDTQFFTITVTEPDVCPADISAYWKMDETSGSPFVDWVGDADANCSSCPDPVAGLIGGAQWFDGTDEVNAPASGIFDWAADASFTIAYWMKTDQSTAGNRVLFGRDDGGSLHMWIGCDDNGTVRFQLREPGGDYVYLGGTGQVLNDNQWHFVMAVRDNDLDRNAIYVDNELIDETTHDYTVGFASTAMLNIGYLNVGGHYRYHGAMDDIAVYDRALTDVEMWQRYENGKANLDLCAAVSPAFISLPVLDGNQGEPYSYNAGATGNPGPTYSLTTAPAGMTIDPVTGMIDWIPADAGPTSVVVAASNSAGTTEQAFTVEVEEFLPFPDCMVSWWRMDETAGPPYRDLRAGFDGTASNTPAPVAGILGGAQLFDGLTDEVDVADADQYDWAGDASFSIEFWMMTNNGGTTQVIVGRDGGDGNDTHWWIGTTTGNTVNFGLRDTAGQYVGTTSTTTVVDGDWHHVVAVRDVALGQNQIWIDGVNEKSMPATYAGNFACNANLNIGYLNLSAHYRYPGAVDEVAIYCRALGETEILAHFNGGAGVEYSDPIPPIITSLPFLMAYEGQAYAYDVEATGVPTATYALTDPPAGMTIDPVTGIIGWVAGSTGVYDVTVTASNGQGDDTQVFAINVSPEPVCPASITSYWKLDEAAGSTYLDSYDGLHASASPAAPAPAAGGIVGGAQYFNGSNNYITVPDDPSLDWAADASFTIELWTNSTESTGNNQVMVGRDQAGGYPHWWIGVNTSGIPFWNMLDTNKNGVAITATEGIRDGEWHHMVAVRDESLNENRLYVDGVRVGLEVYDYTAGFDATTTLGIGYMAYNGNPGYFYKGMLDEVALYGRALTIDEIQHNHDLARMGYGYCDVFAPVFLTSPVTVAAVGQPYSYVAEAFANPLPVTFGLADGPAGMTVDPVTGLVEWVPANAGESPVSLTATNEGGVTTQDFTIATSYGNAPLIMSISDVGNDQGGQIRLVWNRSVHDATDSGLVIEGYGVYRRQDSNKSTNGGDKIAGWDYIDTVPARGDGIYQFVAPTLCDSTDTGGICWSAFFISAMTPDPLVFFDSAVDSGYSVDNLAPPAPVAFQVAYNHLGNTLSWDESLAPDLRSYLVYRGKTVDFEPDASNLVASVVSIEWFDDAAGLEGNPFEFFYRIAAQDFAGNTSDAVQAGDISGVGDSSLPTRFALHNNVPNPFNPMTTIKYDLPVGTRVSLRIFDISGRQIAVLKNSEFETAGRHEVVWRGRDQADRQVAAGVYFYRLEGGTFSQTRRMMLVK